MTVATPTTSGRNWTKQQRAAIERTGHSLLVSAAAGSGKTAVLTERCAYLVCDAPEPCGVDELLVVTFTEAAAAEMRTRLRKAMQERATRHPADERIADQLAAVERATVGTIHAFCGRLLRQHFHAAGLDPNFGILDADASSLLKRETVRRVVARQFECENAADFASLLDAYFDGDDAACGTRVLSIYETLSSIARPDAWIAKVRADLREAASAKSLSDSNLGRTFAGDVAREIETLRARIEAAIAIVKEAGDFPAYVQALDDAGQIAAHWARTLDEDGVDALAEEAEFETPRLPAIKNTVPGKTVAKQAVDDVRKEMKEGNLRAALRFTESAWRDGMAAIVAPAEKLLSLVEQFEHEYRDAKDRLRALDFSDLERRALVLLDGNPSRPSAVARGCHRRFKHVLVDEFQDVNELQESILTLVSHECQGESRSNLFCVGDVKQSIYRFRSAEPELFVRRYDRFREKKSGGEVIDLNANFRSRAGLIGALNAIFERLMTVESSDIDYAEGHQLAVGATFPGDGFHGAPVELHVLSAKPQVNDGQESESAAIVAEPERAEREAAFIVGCIRSLTGVDGSPRARVATNDGTAQRDIKYSDIAILLRTRKFKIAQYADVLGKAGVPVLAHGGSGFFAATEVIDVLSLLRLLDNFRQDIPLAAVLRSPFGALPEPEDSLARIRLAYPDESIPFHEAVVRYEGEQSDELAARLSDFLNRLSAWRMLAQHRPLAEVVATIYEQSGYLAFACGLADGEQRKANLLELHRRASQFGKLQSQSSAGGLSRFLAFLEGLEDEVDAGQASPVAHAVDAVRILTVHESKGLEFPVVFVADLGKKFNLSDARGAILYDKDAGLGLSVVDERRLIRYPSLATTVVAPRLRRKMLAEEMRVLYVGLTRAKEHLILVGTTSTDAAVERWRTRWAGHAGVIPAPDVLGASTSLDWLGPVAMAAGEGVMSVTVHADDPATSLTPSLQDDGGRFAQLAALKPFDPAPPADPTADAVIARLTFAYPHVAYTHAAAAQSVTARAHAKEVSDAEPSIVTVTLPTPRFTTDSHALAATDVGTATHLVLEHLDFAAGAPAVDEQIARLVDRMLMTPGQAKSVDVGSVRWVLTSEVGAILRDNVTTVRRELPVYFAATVDGAPASPDPRDRVMVRGRVDLFVPARDADYLIDYKTDRVTGDVLAERVEAYRQQMSAYADALAAVRGRRPVTWLVFLAHRKVIAV
jgi:ATP-dependent helicase/nuclease subunit A